MSQDFLESQGPIVPGKGSPHLVVKRGHHGRYRFVMIGDGEKIGGEVRVDVMAEGRDGSRVLALARIARLAEALLAGVTPRPVADRNVRAGQGGSPVDDDASDPRLHTILGEGDHRGSL